MAAKFTVIITGSIMATLSAIARPYAQAAYEFAQAKQEISAWQTMLAAAAQTVQQPVISNVLTNTRISSQQWYSLLVDVLKPHLNESRKNFLKLITENKRLSALPTIADLFKEYEAINNKTSEVQVTTAVPMNATQQEKLTEKLTKLLKQQVTLRCDIDENILGGAVVRAGDKVIDGSVRGQLTRLLEFAKR
jgi:F-type H+-transporting ATPase subunit delta